MKTRRWLSFLAVALAAGLSMGASCGKPKPPKPPKPPEPPPAVDVRPTSPVFESHFGVQGERFTAPLTGAIPCWPEDDNALRIEGRVIEYWWPLVSPAWVDHVKAKGANAVLFRLGPGKAEGTCCGMQDVGGPLDETTEDPFDLNPRYWKRAHTVAHHVGKAGLSLQVSVGWDGWLLKYSMRGDPYLPYSEQYVQAGAAVPLNPALRRWVKDVVHEFCNYRNVHYEISNESSLFPGWSAAWERAMYAAIKEDQKQEGCAGLNQLVGSNADDRDGPYDFFITHDPNEVGPVGNPPRPLLTNEYNPALTPSTFRAKACAARDTGQSFWYWRSDGKDSVQDASLNSLDCSKPAVTGCTEPLTPANWFIKLDVGQQGIIDATPYTRGECNYCAEIGMGDFGGQPRCGCPLRNECPGWHCEERLPCEQLALGTSAPIWTSDGAVDYLGYDPATAFRVRCSGGTWMKACDANRSHCTEIPCP